VLENLLLRDNLARLLMVYADGCHFELFGCGSRCGVWWRCGRLKLVVEDVRNGMKIGSQSCGLNLPYSSSGKKMVDSENSRKVTLICIQFSMTTSFEIHLKK
jgi:hypothetical protein